jgi:hypothetical protein
MIEIAILILFSVLFLRHKLVIKSLVQMGYEPFRLMPLLLLVLFAFEFVLADPAVPAASTAASLFRFDPTKRIPVLTETNWPEWSWKIMQTFVAMGVAAGFLTMVHTSADLRTEIPLTAELVEAEASYAQARLARQLATSEDEVKDAKIAITNTKAGVEEAKIAAIASADTSHPLDLPTNPVLRTNCFQLIVRTVDSSLDFLVMNYSPDTLRACWENVRDYFFINTRGIRNNLKVEFFSMVMEPNQKFAEFKNKIVYSARQLNSMSSQELVSEDDQTTVLMNGVRAHHEATFKTTLDVLEQSTEEMSFEDSYRRMLTVARRAETGPSFTTETGLQASAARTPVEACRNFSKGNCRRGRDCKFSHHGPPPARGNIHSSTTLKTLKHSLCGLATLLG